MSLGWLGVTSTVLCLHKGFLGPFVHLILPGAFHGGKKVFPDDQRGSPGSDSSVCAFVGSSPTALQKPLSGATPSFPVPTNTSFPSHQLPGP